MDNQNHDGLSDEQLREVLRALFTNNRLQQILDEMRTAYGGIVTKQLESINEAFTAVNDKWNNDPESADYLIYVLIDGQAYPLIVNAIDISEEIWQWLKSSIAVARENNF